MKKALLFLMGFSPLPMGYALNRFITNGSNAGLGSLLDIFSVLFFLYWGLLGFAFSKSGASKLSISIICNFPAWMVLLLILFQELIHKQYWINGLGFATQMFYLPSLRVSFRFFPNSLHYMWQFYVVSFILFAAIFYAGCLLKDVYTKQSL